MRSYRHSALTGAVLMPLFLASGCSTPELPPVQSYLSPAVPAGLPVPSFNVGLEKPPLRLGDTFVFDNPQEQWEVSAIDGPFIAWQNSLTGDFTQTAWSTLLPPLRWGGNSNALEVGQRKLTQLEGLLFPLKTGNKVSFMEERINARPGGMSIARWECEVGKQVEVVVPAGKAQTWEVVCQVNGRERVLMNYAENLGHYVRYAVDNGNGPTIRQLTGYARGKSADAAPAASPTPTAK